MKERNPSRVNRLTVNSAFFNGYPPKALEFFTLRSSLFTSFNPAAQSLPPEYPLQSPDFR
jgi:hypothetical protein